MTKIIYMANLMHHLEKQLQMPDRKKDAEDCIEIVNWLKSIDQGRVWGSKWRLLTDVSFKGFPSDERTFKPSTIGNAVLKGLKKKPKRKTNLLPKHRYIAFCGVYYYPGSGMDDCLGFFSTIKEAKKVILDYAIAQEYGVETIDKSHDFLWFKIYDLVNKKYVLNK